MANTVSNVSAGKPNASGSIYRAPAGTTLPTTASAELESDFVCLGYASDDGLTNEFSTEDTVKAWGGDVILSTKTDEFKITLIESMNDGVLAAVYGDDNVDGSLADGLTVMANDKQQEPSSWVFDLLLNKDTMKRIVIPKGIVSEVGEIAYKDDEPIGYEITISCGEDEDGNTHYEYFKTIAQETETVLNPPANGETTNTQTGSP